MSKIEYCCYSCVGNYNVLNEDGLVCDGRVRETEEIFFSGSVEQVASVWGVFDGIGGLVGSQKASRIASEIFCDFDYSEYTSFMLSNSLCLANKKIYEKHLNSDERIGTTASVCVIKDGKMYFTSVGDSRIYKLFNEEIVQLTVDDTEFVDGKICLTNALGMALSINPEVYSEAIDCKYYIMCTDGLYKCVSDVRMKEILNSGCSLEDMSDELRVEISKQMIVDNVTFILLKVV